MSGISEYIYSKETEKGKLGMIKLFEYKLR